MKASAAWRIRRARRRLDSARYQLLRLWIGVYEEQDRADHCPSMHVKQLMLRIQQDMQQLDGLETYLKQEARQ
ncbi:MAG: hypothetical protein I3I97_02955 [Bifidobacterium thermophilum]|nr:hypothetical protein [Bifidobacterium thermophilum]